MKRPGLVSFQVRHKETDLFIQAPTDLSDHVSAWVVEARSSIEQYAATHPGFLESYSPFPMDPIAPQIVKNMLSAGMNAGVGPMAAVAGAIAEYVGKRILNKVTGEVIVENGGDVFLYVRSPVTVAIYAGESVLSGRVGIRLYNEDKTVGICTSSGTVGHSRSFGRADAVSVICTDCALADAAATAAGNLVKTKADIHKGLDFLRNIKDILGAVVVKADGIGAFGALELMPL